MRRYEPPRFYRNHPDVEPAEALLAGATVILGRFMGVPLGSVEASVLAVPKARRRTWRRHMPVWVGVFCHSGLYLRLGPRLLGAFYLRPWVVCLDCHGEHLRGRHVQMAAG